MCTTAPHKSRRQAVMCTMEMCKLRTGVAANDHKIPRFGCDWNTVQATRWLRKQNEVDMDTQHCALTTVNSAARETATTTMLAHKEQWADGQAARQPEGKRSAPTTVNRAARDTATTSVPACTCMAEGTTRAATLDATDSHAVLMLWRRGKQVQQ